MCLSWIRHVLEAVIMWSIIAAVVLLFTLWGFGITPRIVTSGSMEPEIHTGSLCFINTNLKFDDVAVGDVIAFQADSGNEVAHRAMEITSEGIVTRGDANQREDAGYRTADTYVGKIVIVIPFLGYILSFLRTPIGIIGILTIVFSIMIFLFIYSKKHQPIGIENK